MKKGLRIFFLILSILGLLVFLGLLVYKNFFDTTLFPSLQNRHLITLSVAFVAALIKLFTRPSSSRSLSYYKNFYAEIIGDAFSDDKKNLRKFLEAVRYYNQDKYEKASVGLNSIKNSCRSRAEKYCVNLFLALNYTDCGDSDSAEKIYEEMINSGIADTRVFSNLSDLYKDSGDFEKSLSVGKRAVDYDRDNYIAHNNLASAYFKNGDFENAAESAKKCLELKNNFLPSIKLLYLIYTLEGNKEQAEIYERKSIANGFSKKDLEEVLKYYLGEED